MELEFISLADSTKLSLAGAGVPSLPFVEALFDHARQIREPLVALADIGGAVHDSPRFGFKGREPAQDAFRLAGLRHVVGQWALLQLLLRLACRLNQVYEVTAATSPK